MPALILFTVVGAALGAVGGNAAAGAAAGAVLALLPLALAIIEWLLKFALETWWLWALLGLVIIAVNATPAKGH